MHVEHGVARRRIRRVAWRQPDLHVTRRHEPRREVAVHATVARHAERRAGKHFGDDGEDAAAALGHLRRHPGAPRLGGAARTEQIGAEHWHRDMRFDRSGVVVDHDHCLAALEDVKLFFHHEVLHLRRAQLGTLGADPQQLLRVRPDGLLTGRASRDGERVARVAGPAAGEVAAVVRVAPAGKGDLVSVEQQRDATGGEQEGGREPEAVHRRAALVHEAFDVVVAEEGRHTVGVGVDVIARHRHGEVAHRAAAREDVADGEVHREIELVVDAGLDPVPVGRAVEMEGDHRGIAVECLAYDAQRGELLLDRRHPRLPVRARHILPRVLPDAVHATHPHPPEGVLDDVARHFGIVLVEIGKESAEPTVERRLAHAGGGVRIGERPPLPGVRQVLGLAAVVPGGGRRVVYPRVIRSRVIGHHVFDDLDAELVRVVHERAVLVERAEVLVRAVEVDGTVAVVVGDALVVVALDLVDVVVVIVDGRHPDCRDAERLEVGKLPAHTGDIAAVVVASLGPVDEPRRLCRRIIARVAVHEAVGHDQVHDIIGIEAGKAPRPGQRRRDGEVKGRSTALGAHRERVRAGLRAGRHGDIHEDVAAGVVHFGAAADERCGAGECRAPEVGAANEQAHRIDGVSRPPVGRFDLGDRGPLRGGERRHHANEHHPRAGDHAAASPWTFTRKTSSAASARKNPPAMTAAMRLLLSRWFITQPKPSEAMISGMTMKKLKMPM